MLCFLPFLTLPRRRSESGQKLDIKAAKDIKFAVFANQRARWCGNLLLYREIPTPVRGLARKDTIFLT